MGQESGEMKHTVQRVNSAAHDMPTNTTTTDISDPDEIRGNIEHTRSSMSETIDALQERLNPHHLVDEAKESLRGATIGKVEGMMDSARDSVQGASNGIMGTIRDNPVPMALVGIGLGWLFLRGRNRSQQTNYATYNRPANGYYAGRGYDSSPTPYRQNDNRGYPQTQHGQPTTNGVADKANQMAGQAQDIGSKAQDTMQQVAGQAQDTMQQFGEQAQYQAQQARGWFEDTLRESPFAVGAVALAVGALVGLAIPETPQENQLLGDTRDSLIDKAQDAAQDTLQKVQSVAQDTTDAAKQAAQQAAQRQGLTGNGNATPSASTPTANGTSNPSRS